jgi:hypothetical protein
MAARRNEAAPDRLEMERMGDQDASARTAGAPAVAGSFVKQEGRGAEAGAVLVPVAERGTPPPLPAPIASFVF